jgi:SAM-dependent methyltransferase
MANDIQPGSMFRREDESPDSIFYESPRYEKHIDDATIDAITQIYLEHLDPDAAILDLMSSWISHLPDHMQFAKVSGLGMNEAELRRNSRLDDFVVHDLNEHPDLPYAANSFDAVLIAVSVQYLIRPVEVFKSIGNVLKPGGRCIVSLSHRVFPTKAVHAFLLLPAQQRCKLVESYFHNAGNFRQVVAVDRSPVNADPLWIVMAEKISSQA